MKTLLIFVVSAIALVSSEFHCTPGSKFQMDCNSCTCSNDGKTAMCTGIACIQENKDDVTDTGEKAETVEPVQTQGVGQAEFRCTPGSNFHQDCNSCICLKDGQSAMCTGIACPKKVKRDVKTGPQQVCVPKVQFNDYCNTCGCADDGLSFICTRRMCDPEIWNKDGTMKISPKSLQRAARSISSDHKCKPGHLFKNDCNHCICDADGATAQCTVLDCSKLDLSQFHNNPLYIKPAHNPRK